MAEVAAARIARRSALALLLLSVLGVCSAARSAADHQWQTGGGVHRKLQQYRPTGSFPYGRCGSFKSSGQPYYLVGPTVTVDNDAAQTATFEFTIGYRGPSKSQDPCYQKLEQSLHNIVLNIYTECIEAVDIPHYAAIDGKRHTYYTYEHPEGTALSITQLRLNATTAAGARLQIRAAYPCNAPDYFFVSNVYQNATAEVVFSESSSHRCCGRQPNVISPPPHSPAIARP